MRRKKVFTEMYQTLDQAVEYIKRVKDINGNQVQIEMSEMNWGIVSAWCVEVWQVRRIA